MAQHHIEAGGQVSITASHGEEPPVFSDGTFDGFSDVDPNTETVTFSDAHGLLTGDTVTYNQNTAGSALIGLVDGRDYNVIVSGVNALQFGVQFDSADSSNVPFVDIERDEIAFQTPHNLEDGDTVIYTPLTGSAVIVGLTSGKTYIVNSIDRFTLKLIDPDNVPGGAALEFIGANINGSTFNIVGHGFANGQAVTYRRPTTSQFGTPGVDEDANTIQINTDHGFAAGEEVIYQTDGAAIGGLNSGSRYFVILDASNPGIIQLAATYDQAVGN